MEQSRSCLILGWSKADSSKAKMVTNKPKGIKLSSSRTHAESSLAWSYPNNAYAPPEVSMSHGGIRGQAPDSEGYLYFAI